MNDFFETLKARFKKLKSVNIAFAVGMLGIALIALSSFFEPKEKTQEEFAEQDSDLQNITLQFQKSKTKELEELLEAIDGVGSVKVMLNVECSEEYVYAIFESKAKSEELENSSYDYQYDYFTKETDGDTEPVMTKIINPKVSSCVVACKGANDAKVRESVYLAVSSALDISVGDVYVAALG